MNKEEKFKKLIKHIDEVSWLGFIKEIEQLQQENKQLKLELLEKKCSDKDVEYQEKLKLQQRIDKANKILGEILVIKQGNVYRPVKNTKAQDVYKTIIELNTILDTPHRMKDDSNE